MAFTWAGGVLERLAELGIEPYEVQQVLGYGRRWPRLGHSPAGTVLTIWGRTATGRALLLVLWPDRGTLNAHITGARELTADEEQQLQEWEATR
ncbi:hypothetical protein ACFFX1_11025 [Dactylosporangium sucinum]|uniref:Uncharacterized protein n=1 Tax=Dactylosporangium sucinum TaxID=1424081 RepID=A0A917TH24_9ACTN|nr:hypothetical protein [Dactylosporangium sucinum]GGM22607.1 hypothetical protein GCM10007977_024720 [Dactylosporangium sucinum]